MNVPSHQTIIVNSNNNSGIGTAGLAFSILGWLTCGILSPIGALLSLFGLFCRGSKSHAIAGLLVGFPGVIFLFTFGFAFVAGILGIGAATSAAIAEAQRTVEQKRMAESAAVSVAPIVDQEPLAEPIAPLPPVPTIADAPISPEPEPPAEALEVAKQAELAKQAEAEAEQKQLSAAERRRARAAEKAASIPLRDWTSKDGKFTTKAKFVGRLGNKITIEKEDGKQVTIDLEKLSDADIQYVKDL